MPKTLIVAEKPSVARDIAAALNVPKAGQHFESDTIVVSNCIGHLVEIFCPEADADRWKVPVIPSNFELRTSGNRDAQFKLLKTLFGRSDVTSIVNACDAGREGEAIFRLTYELAKCKKPTHRMWLQTMTKPGILKAWSDRKSGALYDNLAFAARSRMEADWLVGINGSRASRNAVGRVMTPTLAMIVSAYLNHKNFVAQDYWEIYGHFTVAAGTYTAKWLPALDPVQQRAQKQAHGQAQDQARDQARDQADQKRAEARARFFDQKQAHAFLTRLQNAQPSSIVDAFKVIHAAPPPLFDLTTLQREANRLFKFSAAKTLEIAQALYETHKVCSYPRTDSQALPEDYVDKCAQVVNLLGRANPDFLPFTQAIIQNTWVRPNKAIFDNGKISDHFAIIPTGATSSTLSKDESKIYDLVCRRFLAAFHPEAVFNQTTRTTLVAGETFKVAGKVLIQPGWKAVYGSESKTPDEIQLPALTKGETGKVTKYEVRASKTKAPPPHTESTLLRAMETAGKTVTDGELAAVLKERGIGTPATRAAIIEKIKDTRGFQGRTKEPFVHLDKNFLIPSDKGLALIAYLTRVYPEITSPALTGQWEYQLKQMEQGALVRSIFMQDMRQTVEKMVEKILKVPMTPAQ